MPTFAELGLPSGGPSLQGRGGRQADKATPAADLDGPWVAIHVPHPDRHLRWGHRGHGEGRGGDTPGSASASLFSAAGLPPVPPQVGVADHLGRADVVVVRVLVRICQGAHPAVDGIPGMTAVMRVVRNRVADPRFPGDACAVIAQSGQFQPLTESPLLRQVARDPEGYSMPQVLGVRSPQARLLLVTVHRLARAPLPNRDPTGGALYFVNPELMDPARCPWFAELKRTARIGSHVFLTDYQPGESRGAPALDCGQAGSRRVVTGDLAR